MVGLLCTEGVLFTHAGRDSQWVGFFLLLLFLCLLLSFGLTPYRNDFVLVHVLVNGFPLLLFIIFLCSFCMFSGITFYSFSELTCFVNANSNLR